MDFSEYHVMKHVALGSYSVVRQDGPFSVPQGFVELFGAEREEVLAMLYPITLPGPHPSAAAGQ
jgi:hypothetical protein